MTIGKDLMRVASLAILALFIAALYPRALFAQAPPNPSDLELKAAYCMGYWVDSRNWLAQSPFCSGSPDQLCTDQQRQDNERISRLTAYLFTHGWVTTNKDSTPIFFADMRGEQDAQECRRYATTPQAKECEQQQCAEQCAGGSLHVNMNVCGACMRSSCSPPACQRISACTNLDAELPF